MRQSADRWAGQGDERRGTGCDERMARVRERRVDAMDARGVGPRAWALAACLMTAIVVPVGAQRRAPAPVQVELLRETPRGGAICGETATTTWRACRVLSRCDERRVSSDMLAALHAAIEARVGGHVERRCTRAGCGPARSQSASNHFACEGAARLCVTRDVESTCLARAGQRDDERAPQRTRPVDDDPPRRMPPAARADDAAPRARDTRSDDAARVARPVREPRAESDGDPFEPASGPVAVRTGGERARARAAYLFPGRAESLDAGELWYWKAPDGHGSGTQRYAYDLTTARWDEASGRWSECVAGRDGQAKCRYCSQAERNADCLVYGEPLHAMAAGRVVRCWRNAPENPRPGQRHPARDSSPPRIGGGGNALVVEHADGTYALYAHMQPGTIPQALCPHEAELMRDAGDTTEAEVPEAQQARVEAGQFLGRVGNSGASGNPHVHVHVQDGPTKQSDGVPLDFSGARIDEDVAPESIDWTRLDGRTRPTATSVIWPDFSKGLPEIAYHGLRDVDYQRLFDHAEESGYQPAWIDGFELRGRVFYNVIFRPRSAPWSAVHGLTGAQYQAEYERRERAGYRLRHVDAYTWRGEARYAALFVKDGGPEVAAYHGRSAAEHQRLFEDWSAAGWRARNVSVVSLGGQRRYTALYEKGGPDVRLESASSPAEYQEEYERNRDAGLHLAYVNAYVHEGRLFYSAIWSRQAEGVTVARHGLDGAAYQQQWEQARRGGKLTRAISAADVDGRASYVAYWR